MNPGDNANCKSPANCFSERCNQTVRKQCRSTQFIVKLNVFYKSRWDLRCAQRTAIFDKLYAVIGSACWRLIRINEQPRYHAEYRAPRYEL